MWSLIRSILSSLGLKGDVKDVYPLENEREEIGTSGVIEADLAVVKKGERLVLAIDYDLGDMPTWVEWDASVNQFSIAQNGGAVAHVASKVGHDQVEVLQKIKKLMLVSNMNGEKIAHHIPFVVRAKAV